MPAAVGVAAVSAGGAGVNYATSLETTLDNPGSPYGAHTTESSGYCALHPEIMATTVMARAGFFHVRAGRQPGRRA